MACSFDIFSIFTNFYYKNQKSKNPLQYLHSVTTVSPKQKLISINLTILLKEIQNSLSLLDIHSGIYFKAENPQKNKENISQNGQLRILT